MDDMTTAYINPAVLAWAMKRRGVSPDDLATSALKAESIQAWLDAKQFPSETHAEILADKLRVPYLVLFLDSVPDIDTVDLPDLRTSESRRVSNPSIDFIDTVNDVLIRQD